jgi:predicted amidohydrolase
MSRFAAVQMEPALLDPEANLRRVIDGIGLAAERGAAVAVFPECALTGYALTADEAAEAAEAIPGDRTRRLQAACRTARLIVQVGTIERDEDGQCFNAAVLIGPDGVLARYRKTHLPLLGVDRYLAAGDELPSPAVTPAGRLGTLICYDLRFPEPARVLTLLGAQVVLLSTAWPAAAGLYPDFLARARAAENRVYLVAANRIGEERGTRYLGRSLIVSPEGEILAQASPDREETLIADVNPAEADRKRLVYVPGEYELDLIGDRRPELYGPIAVERRSPSA